MCQYSVSKTHNSVEYFSQLHVLVTAYSSNRDAACKMLCSV